MAKVYISSTRLDLKEYREAVSKAIRRAGHVDVAMEYYVAEHRPPVEKCLDDVAASDLYVGLFAWRYGWIPEENNPSRLSITEMEYRRAAESGKQCLVFLLSDEAPWPLKFVDSDRTRIEALRDELGAKHSSGPPFKTPDELGRLVGEAIRQWEKEHGHVPPRPSIPELDLDTYFNALSRRYQHLDLDALTPPQRDENLRQRLREIFVEQNVRENPPPVELPKEVWEKLQRDREVHAEDLPAGVTPDDVLRARESYFEKPSRPVLEALTDPAHRRAIVLGDPGAGKSTLARYVLLSLLGVEGDEKLRRAFEGHLPLLVELRSYAGLCSKVKDSSFLDFIEHMSESEGWGLDRKALEHYLKEDGRAIVVFDGLDEIFDPEERESAARRIAGFASSYPRARVVVTSRVIGYRRKVLTDADFSHFTLQDLDERQVEQFIDRWYALALDERPDEARARRERIMRSFKDSPSIRQLAGNPMLLTIMAIIGKNQELPRERWKLYDHAAGVLIYHWDVERHLRDRHLDAPFIGEEEKKELLRRLAFKMQSGEGGLAGNYIHRDDLQREFESYLRERFVLSPADAATIARAMIEQFRERNFILSLHGATLYGFVHRAFLEFFCASAFVQMFEKTQELTLENLKCDIFGTHWADQTWHEVLRLICGMIDEKFTGEVILHLTEAVNSSWQSEPLINVPNNILLAIECLSEVRNSSSTEIPSERLLKAICLLFDEVLGRADGEEAIDENTLENMLEPSLRAIGTQWSNRNVLVAWLKNLKSSDWAWYYASPFAMFVSSVGEDMPEVYRIIKGYAAKADSNYRALVPITLAMGWTDHSKTFTKILNMAIKDIDADVRYVAVTTLTTFYPENEKTLQSLRDYMVTDSDEDIRGTALSALAEELPDDPETLRLLHHHAINDKSAHTRYDAIESLAEHFLLHEQTLALLCKLEKEEQSEWVLKLIRESINVIEQQEP